MLSTEQKQKTQKPEVKAQEKRAESRLAFAGKIIVWQIVAFLVVELALSIAGLGEEEMFKLDPELGFKHMSHKKVTWRSEGFSSSYFNADGMREPGLTVAKPAGTYRVALLGDSLTESLQVPLEKSFGYQVQEKISRDLNRPVQVLNFGTSGYSTVQEYLQLKNQVLKYKPDLVLLCYNSRDCFENWSPPDEVITNVRPAALHLPGGKLNVVTTPVTQWMKTPRARFLKQVEFLRERSRLWGLFSAAELDWSMHNEAYKRVILLFTRPGKAIRQTAVDLSDYWKTTRKNISAQFKATFTAKAAQATAPASSAATASPAPAAGSDATKIQATVTCSATTASSGPTAGSAANTSPAPAASSAVTAKPAASTSSATAPAASSGKSPKPSIYEQLIVRTLGSLLYEMKVASNLSGAKFSVVALPVRSALSVRQGMETAFNNYDYDYELGILKDICGEKEIPFVNVHDAARTLSKEDKDYLFYLVHLTPRGHNFVADQLSPAVKQHMTGSAKK